MYQSVATAPRKCVTSGLGCRYRFRGLPATLSGGRLTWENRTLLAIWPARRCWSGCAARWKVDRGLPATLHEGAAEVSGSRVARSAIGCDADDALDPDKRLRSLCGALGPHPRKKQKSESRRGTGKGAPNRTRARRSTRGLSEQFRWFREHDLGTTMLTYQTPVVSRSWQDPGLIPRWQVTVVVPPKTALRCAGVITASICGLAQMCDVMHVFWRGKNA